MKRAHVAAMCLVLFLVPAASAPAYTLLHTHRPFESRSLGALVRDGAGNFYGTTFEGGSANSGTVFTVKQDGTGFTILHEFSSAVGDGGGPAGALALDGDGYLYGTTGQGVLSADHGVLYKLKTDGTGFQILHVFAGGMGDGIVEIATAVVLDGSGNLYGTTKYGGTSNSGIVYTIQTNGSGFQVLHSFSSALTDGRYPAASLLYGGDNLYGTTYQGGASGKGTIFTIKTNGTGFGLLRSLNDADGINPIAELVVGTFGTFYGTASDGGGVGGLGTVFKLQPNGDGFTVLHTFHDDPGDGAIPSAAVFDDAGIIRGTTAAGGASGHGTIFSIGADGTGFGLTKSFTGGNDGGAPYAKLVPGDSGYLVGTTYDGGAYGAGSVFTLYAGATFQSRYSFRGAVNDEGVLPVGSLVEDASGNLYGVTSLGGAANAGTVFTMKKNGTGFALLHSFAGGDLDGAVPEDSLVLDESGVLYGTTQGGGPADAGTVFRIGTDGNGFAILHPFSGETSNGRAPTAALTRDGTALYGTTFFGGEHDAGTVFTLQTNGTGFQLLHSFSADANAPRQPNGPVTLDGAGKLYGVTVFGGASDLGTVYTIGTNGLDFAVVTPFAGGQTGGSYPRGALALDGSGNLYGVSQGGGPAGTGTVYTVKTTGTGFALLHGFTVGNHDGQSPTTLLLAGTILYGTTNGGGAFDRGTVFRVKTDASGYGILHAFAGAPDDGGNPTGLLLDAPAATLYGVTNLGGAAEFGTEFSLSRFLIGDVNGDENVNVSDVLYLINRLFAGGPDPVGPADVNGDENVNVSDVLYLINYLFAGGPAPI